MRQLLFLVLLGAALAGSLPLGLERWRLFAYWRSAPLPERQAVLYGPYAEVVATVRRSVPESGTILLFSGVDPALLPYALFPRRIWQVRTDPETNEFYMRLPPAVFPQRPSGSFSVGWQLFLSPENLASGGELHPVESSLPWGRP